VREKKKYKSGIPFWPQASSPNLGKFCPIKKVVVGLDGLMLYLKRPGFEIPPFFRKLLPLLLNDVYKLLFGRRGCFY
jgi:hypothetical protein